MKEKIIVIGNGMVGYKFCERLTDKDTENKFEITTFCEEPRPAYDRVHLSYYFDGKTVEDLTMAKIEWYEEKGISIHIGDKAVAIDRENKTVTSAKGVSIPYDKLILATGSDAFVPPVPGIDKEGVFVYRTIEDLEVVELDMLLDLLYYQYHHLYVFQVDSLFLSHLDYLHYSRQE